MDYLVQAKIVQVITSGLRQTYDQIAGQIPAHPTTAKRHIVILMNLGVIERSGKGHRGSYIYKIDTNKAHELGYI